MFVEMKISMNRFDWIRKEKSGVDFEISLDSINSREGNEARYPLDINVSSILMKFLAGDLRCERGRLVVV